jgi:transcriptional regulator with XRE-family HTH domain
MAQNQIDKNHKQFLGYMRRLSQSHLTYAQIAAHLGVSERSIYKWVSKERKVSFVLLIAMEKVVEDRGA